MTYRNLIGTQVGTNKALYLFGANANAELLNGALAPAKYGTGSAVAGVDGTTTAYNQRSLIFRWNVTDAISTNFSASGWYYRPSAYTATDMTLMSFTAIGAINSETRITAYKPNTTYTEGFLDFNGTYIAVNNPANTWHHFAVINTATAVKVYWDGVLVHTGASLDIDSNTAVLSGYSSTSSSTSVTNPPRVDNYTIIATKALSTAEVEDQYYYFNERPAADDIVFTTTPATAAGVAGDATFNNSTPAVISAGAMTASALMGDSSADITTDDGNIVKRGLAAALYLNNTPITSSTFGRATSSIYESKTFYIEVPTLASLGMDPNDDIAAIRLRLKQVTGVTIDTYTATAVNARQQQAGDPLLGSGSTPDEGGTLVLDVPLGYTDVMFIVSGRYAGVAFDNPAVDTAGYENSYFEISYMPAPVNADVLAESAMASVDMPGGYFADFTHTATITDGTAEMRTAWFRSDKQFTVEFATADADMFADTEAGVISNIDVLAEPALLTRANIRNPLEVNDDTTNPHWVRVTGRATEGTLPPRTGEWYRLNEQSGNIAHRTDMNTGLRLAFAERTAGATLSGLYEWGAEGPNGQRALKVVNAGMDVESNDTWNSGGFLGTNNVNGHSYEFTLRVDPGHTGRMDIANGTVTPLVNNAPGDNNYYVNIGVRNGKIYAAERNGGTSTKRIDDGQWHHVVVTPGAPYFDADVIGGGSGLYPLEIYIDGVRDRRLVRHENNNGGALVEGMKLARADHYFGQDTNYPFKGEILELISRDLPLNNSMVMDLYLDMFGYKAVRAGLVGAAVAAMGQDTKVISSMKRMLVLTWKPTLAKVEPRKGIALGFNEGREDLMNDPAYQHSIIAEAYGTNPILGPPLGYGYDENLDTGRYLVTYQHVGYIKYPGLEHTAVTESARAAMGLYGDSTGVGGYGGKFRDLQTGADRLINLQTDVDLDQFDIIAFQAYPNPINLTQVERQQYEDFLYSVNTALVEGHKLWVTDPALAADLGWVSDIDEVPVLADMTAGNIPNSKAYGNDVRGYELAPWIGLHGVAMEKPEDGSMPQLETGYPDGASAGLQNLWRFDMHKNNGYRVVNEVPGLTDLPSWEVDEHFMRDRFEMIPDGVQHAQWGWKLFNLSGESWYGDDIVPTGPNAGKIKLTMTSREGPAGLRAGDQFYDWTWTVGAITYYRATVEYPGWRQLNFALRDRTHRTWAVPPGHLRVGTPLTTFRTHIWNDYGNEVLNPYRNHIRNFVIQPGDRLPDGRKVNGYAFTELAEQPWFSQSSGTGILIDERNAEGDRAIPDVEGYRVEDEYSVIWDYLTMGRQTYGGGGVIEYKERVLLWSQTNSETGKSQFGIKVIPAFNLPLGQSRNPVHDQHFVPHQTWNSRGISWLTLVESVDAEVALEMADFASGTATMVAPAVEVDFDNVVTVGAASATATIVDPGETALRSANVLAFAATASATMRGLQGGYLAQAATGFADMPQNVRRPLDIAEVLFFTLTFNLEPINLRMEEN